MSREPERTESTGADCPYCEGIGCSECGESGERWGTAITTEDGLNIRAHGSGPMTEQMQEALVALARAAFKKMDGETP